MATNTTGAILALFVAAGTAGCSGSDEIKWTEEVKLHDGKTVQLKRRTELSSSGFPVQRRGIPRYQEFCYPPLDIHWKSKSVYRPDVFDVVEGKAYVRVPVTGCVECMLHKFPASDALYFVWDGAAWKRIEHHEFPPKLRFNLMENAYFNDDGKEDARGLVTLAEKERRYAGIYYEMKITGGASPHRRGACERYKGVRVQTDETNEVFVRSSTKTCDGT